MPPAGGVPPPPPPFALREPDSKPEYTPPASQCQISTTALLTAPTVPSALQMLLSCTRSATCRVVPGRSSRMSLRMESTSNQYGP